MTPFAVLAVRTPTLPPATHTNAYRLGDCVIDAIGVGQRFPKAAGA